MAHSELYVKHGAVCTRIPIKCVCMLKRGSMLTVICYFTYLPASLSSPRAMALASRDKILYLDSTYTHAMHREVNVLLHCGPLLTLPYWGCLCRQEEQALLTHEHCTPCRRQTHPGDDLRVAVPGADGRQSGADCASLPLRAHRCGRRRRTVRHRHRRLWVGFRALGGGYMGLCGAAGGRKGKHQFGLL